eukprot:g9813.t1
MGVDADAESPVALVPELRYVCTCGTCVATSEGYVEAREGALLFRSLAFECRGQHVICPDCEQALGSKHENHEPRYKYQIDDGYLCSLNKYRGCVMPTRGIGDIDMEPLKQTSAARIGSPCAIRPSTWRIH